MKLLGLDVATATGFCIYEHLGAGKPPRIRCGSWKCSAAGFDAKAEMLSDFLTDLLREERHSGDPVAYAAVEEPLKIIPGGERHDLAGSYKTNAGTAETIGILHAMAGSACAILRQFKVPKRIVTPAAWRKSFIGISRAPASVPRNKGSAWLKREVRNAADALGDKYGFNVPNNDASDAIGVAFWLAANVSHMRAEDDLLRRRAA